jgi:hypothetical protein
LIVGSTLHKSVAAEVEIKLGVRGESEVGIAAASAPVAQLLASDATPETATTVRIARIKRIQYAFG